VLREQAARMTAPDQRQTLHFFLHRRARLHVDSSPPQTGLSCQCRCALSLAGRLRRSGALVRKVRKGRQQVLGVGKRRKASQDEVRAGLC
jgi:hypothetical protein